MYWLETRAATLGRVTLIRLLVTFHVQPTHAATPHHPVLQPHLQAPPGSSALVTTSAAIKYLLLASEEAFCVSNQGIVRPR